MKFFFRAVLIISVSVFAVLTISERNKELKNAPVEQFVESAGITVTAPPFVRREGLEEKAKERLKDKVKELYYYSSSYKKADYLIYYCEYENEVKLQPGINSVIENLKDSNFRYETAENKLEDGERLFITGHFEKNGKEFGIKQQMVKKGKTRFWQIITIYPYSEKNEKTAESFIKSVSFGGFEKGEA